MQEYCKSGLLIAGFCTVLTGMFFLHCSSVFHWTDFLQHIRKIFHPADKPLLGKFISHSSPVFFLTVKSLCVCLGLNLYPSVVVFFLNQTSTILQKRRAWLWPSEDAPWPEARCLCSRQPHVCSWVKRGRGSDAGGGRGSFFFMSTLQYLRLSSKPAAKAFSSAKHFNAINLYKSFLRSLSLSPSVFLSGPLLLFSRSV